MYDVAVHKNANIPVVQKFVHLKSLLTGEAARCVASIATTESNYAVVIDRLQGRYGKTEAQKHVLMTKLMALKNVDS